jgi:hypothetical protein
MSGGERVCVACGASLAGRRVDARTCSSGCRREAYRLAMLATGAPDAFYRTLDHYTGRQRRAKRLGRE